MKKLIVLLLVCTLALPLFAGGQRDAAPAPAAPVVEEEFDLEALIEAAQAEGELVAYFTSGRIDAVGNLFEEKYGIRVRGTKMGDPEQAERVIREVDAGNVQVDVIGFEDGPLLETQLIPRGYVQSWVPPDLKDVISEEDQNPLVFLWQPRIFGYNGEVYADGSPVNNVWELTEPQWKGKILIRDPGLTPAHLGFFASMITNHQMLEQAYVDLYGRQLVTNEENAGWEFLKRLFQNDIISFRSDSDVGDAVGSAGQTDPPVGFYVLTKHRDNAAKNLSLTTMQGLQPFMGYALPTYALIVKDAPNPNAAKLFVHFILTEGHYPWTGRDIGAFSSNRTIPPHPLNEGTWDEWTQKLLPVDNVQAMRMRQDIMDFWLEYGAN